MGVGISLVNGKGFLEHNERKYFKSNVDKERSNDNIQIYSLKLDEAYNKYFKNSIDEYNSKQTRKDRIKSVDGYLAELQRNERKKGAEKPFYEVIVQIGDKDTCNITKNKEQANKAKEALLEYINKWSERNPNLKVFNATLHMDESTPHLHIDYIPVAHGYKQGLKERNSLSKALENQGLGKGKGQFDNASVKWQKQEREELAKIAMKYGFEIEDKKVKRQSLTVAEFKNEKDKLNEQLNKNINDIKPVKTLLGRSLVSDESLNKNIKLGQLAAKTINANKLYKEQLHDREVAVIQKETELSKREEMIEYKESRTELLYKEQSELNQKYKDLNAENRDLKSEILKLEREHRNLLDQVEKSYQKGIDDGYEKGYKIGEHKGENKGAFKILKAYSIPVRKKDGFSIDQDKNRYSLFEDTRTGLEISVPFGKEKELVAVKDRQLCKSIDEYIDNSMKNLKSQINERNKGRER